MFARRRVHGGDGAGSGAGLERTESSWSIDRAWTLCAEQGERRKNSFLGRRDERLGRGDGIEQRGAELSCQWQSRSVERTAGHAAPTDARSPSGAVPPEATLGADRRMR